MPAPRISWPGRADLAKCVHGWASEVAEVREGLAELSKLVRSRKGSQADRLLLRAAETLYELSVAITLGSVEFVEPAPDSQADLFPED